MSITNEERERLGQAARAARDHACAVLGSRLPRYQFTWSNRLTRSAGQVTWKRPPRVALSGPIFRRATEELGIEAACEEVRATLFHELAHIVIGRDGNHNQRWAAVMVELGVEPLIHHELTCGLALNPDAEGWRVGNLTWFEHRDEVYGGRITRLNQKRATVLTEGRRRWLIPYRLLHSTDE